MSQKERELLEVEYLSPAMVLVQHVWRSACDAAPHSWERFNGAMKSALFLAIRGGLRFDKEDFKKLQEEHRPWRWIGSEGYELAYTEAVDCKNISAAQSIEAYLERKPFMFPVESGRTVTGYPRKRLARGTSFFWGAPGLERVTVTSFDDKKALVRACSYHPRTYDDRGYAKGSVKVKHRFSISHADLRDAVKAKKAAEDAATKALADTKWEAAL